ncbi:MAG: hypothetical protein RJB62_1737 [Pseudomonadota bacterium]
MTLTVPAFAADYGNAEIINGQLNLAPVWSTLNTTIDTVDGDAAAMAQGVGNTVNIFTMSNTYVDNNQVQIGNVGAEVDIEATGVGGDLLIGATALCNGASISTDPDVTAVNSNQLCGAKDPSATVNADVSDVAGGVGIAAMAVSNQIQVDSNANNFPMNSYQENRAGTYATVNATISNVGAVDLSSTAVGNSATFIHYP